MENVQRVTSTSSRLLEAMKDANKKQIDLARETGLHHSTVSRYLSGAVEPRQSAMHKLAVLLNVSEMWLWGYDVPKHGMSEQKKNDDPNRVIAKLRNDPKFFKVVSILADLPPAEYDSIKLLLSRLEEK